MFDVCPCCEPNMNLSPLADKDSISSSTMTRSVSATTIPVSNADEPPATIYSNLVYSDGMPPPNTESLPA